MPTQPSDVRQVVPRGARAGIIADPTSGDEQVQQAPLTVAVRVQFDVHTTFGPPDKTYTPPFFDGHAGRGSVGLEVCRVDHHGFLFAVVQRQTHQQLSENGFITPLLPALVQRLVQPVFPRRITPSQAIAINEYSSIQNAPSPCPTNRKDQTC